MFLIKPLTLLRFSRLSTKTRSLSFLSFVSWSLVQFLDVQAVVDADKRYVTMNLRPGVSQPVGPMSVIPYSGGASGAATAADAFIQLPNIQRQVVRTTVSVPDGGTLLIGGMKTTQEIETEAGVPVLSKIPVLKRLYSARNIVKDEQVLLILVKPTIIIQREQEEEAFPTFGQKF